MGHDFELLSMISDITFKFNFDFPFAIDAMLFSTSNLFSLSIENKVSNKIKPKSLWKGGGGRGWVHRSLSRKKRTNALIGALKCSPI